MALRKWYMLEQGMRNPRNPEEIGWREWEAFGTLQEAKACGRKSKLELYRVLEIIEVFVSEVGSANTAA